MLGAIYLGLSGMNAYSKGLQTISNNVANLNTSGFKSTTVSFTDLFSHGGGGSSFSDQAANDRSGYGVRFADPLIDFKQGDLRSTTNDLDLAIKGAGFFVMQNGDRTFYARTGSFVIDKDGFLSEQGSENRLAVLDAAGRAVSLNIDAKRTSQPLVTTKISFADNLSSSATGDVTIPNVAVYDSRGGKQVWSIVFSKSTATGATNEWKVTVKNAGGDTVGTSTLKFIGNIVDPATEQFVITNNPDGADPLSVTLDFSKNVTSFSGGTTSTLRVAAVDGHGTGSLTTLTVDENGKVKLSYSNDQSETLGAVALADFRSPQELVRAGGGLYEDKGNAGIRLLASGTEGIGTIVPKQIEASNVDLSAEFGDLILVQRGYQASSQVVSIANDMIQQLFGIRGQ